MQKLIAMPAIKPAQRCSITTVNYHFWKKCDMNCGHCFAKFNDASHAQLDRAAALAVIRELAQGFERITLVGGEPTACPWLVDCLDLARELGMRTSIVTNGALLHSKPDLRASILARIEWIGISVDSINRTTNQKIGRVQGKNILEAEQLSELADAVHAANVQLKINTVVQRANVAEDLSPILLRMKPARWKALQVLQVRGQNDAQYQSLAITAQEFQQFLDRHQRLAAASIVIVPEDHDAMTGSYAMVDPGGYAYDNVEGTHHYSEAPIHQIGWRAAFAEVSLLPERFLARGGNHA